MKRVIKFIKTPFGSMVTLLACVAIGALLIHGGNRSERPISTAATSPAPMERHTITRDGQELRVPASIRTPAPIPARADPGEETISRPRAARQDSDNAPAGRKAATVLPISLLAANNTTGAAGADAAPARNYAPYGRLISCETVITLDSSKLDTPSLDSSPRTCGMTDASSFRRARKSTGAGRPTARANASPPPASG